MAYEDYLEVVTSLAQEAVPSAEPVIQVENSWPNLLGLTTSQAGGAVTFTVTGSSVVNALFTSESTENKALIADKLNETGNPAELIDKFLDNTATICHDVLE